MNKKINTTQKQERGSALVYILIAIALLAALTTTFMEPSSQQTSSQNTFRTISDLKSNISIIQAAIQECVLVYPEGDSCINNGPDAHCTTASTTDLGARKNYPLNPNSDHFANATPAQSGDRLVRNIRCPGDNGGDNADHDNHELIFGGTSGKFLPPAPPLFEDWQYYNGTDGIYFWTETDKTDAFIDTALQKLDDQFSECEADIIDATSGAIDLDSAGTADTQCTSGSTCFRVWMKINDATAEYNGDTDGEEAAASCDP